MWNYDIQEKLHGKRYETYRKLKIKWLHYFFRTSHDTKGTLYVMHVWNFWEIDMKLKENLGTQCWLFYETLIALKGHSIKYGERSFSGLKQKWW